MARGICRTFWSWVTTFAVVRIEMKYRLNSSCPYSVTTFAVVRIEMRYLGWTLPTKSCVTTFAVVRIEMSV